MNKSQVTPLLVLIALVGIVAGCASDGAKYPAHSHSDDHAHFKNGSSNSDTHGEATYYRESSPTPTASPSIGVSTGSTAGNVNKSAFGVFP
jgi:hypothetical protein